MDSVQQYHIQTHRNLESGQLPVFTNPGEPADETSEALTADEIKWFRALKKEIETRFNPPLGL